MKKISFIIASSVLLLMLVGCGKSKIDPNKLQNFYITTASGVELIFYENRTVHETNLGPNFKNVGYGALEYPDNLGLSYHDGELYRISVGKSFTETIFGITPSTTKDELVNDLGFVPIGEDEVRKIFKETDTGFVMVEDKEEISRIERGFIIYITLEEAGISHIYIGDVNKEVGFDEDIKPPNVRTASQKALASAKAAIEVGETYLGRTITYKEANEKLESLLKDMKYLEDLEDTANNYRADLAVLYWINALSSVISIDNKAGALESYDNVVTTLEEFESFMK
jgi:hypothetical protein